MAVGIAVGAGVTAGAHATSRISSIDNAQNFERAISVSPFS